MADLTTSADVDALLAAASKAAMRAVLGIDASGCYYFSTPAATTLSAATPAKAAGTTTSLGATSFTVGTNRLTYDGTETLTFRVSCSVSLTKASGGATTGTVWLAKNGSVVTGARVDRTLANTSDEGAMAVTACVSLATSDYVELWLEDVNGDDLTVESGTVTVSYGGA